MEATRMGQDDEDDEEDFDTEVPTGAVDAKIAEYEAFVENVMKRDLQMCLENFRQDKGILEQCRELRHNIDMLIQDRVKELETMVELGCQFYVKAFVPDTSKIFIDVGLGFHLEMPLEEARGFLVQKEEVLSGRFELHKQKSAQIKADIHEVLHMLDLMTQVRMGGTPWLEMCDEGLTASFAGMS